MTDQNQPFLRALAGETVSPPPIWLMRQAGRYLPEYREVRANQPDFINFCLNSDAAAEVTLQPIRRYGFDASIVFADILLIPYGLGQKVWFEKGEGPKLEPLALETIGALSVERANEVLSPVSDTIRKVRAGLPDTCSLIGFAGSPWTVATYMIEGGGSKDRFKARTLAWSQPEAFDALMNLLAEASAQYLKAQADAGANALKLFDSWAEGLPDPLFDRVIIRPTKLIIDRLRQMGVTLPVIGFPRGAGPQAVRYAKETGWITGWIQSGRATLSRKICRCRVSLIRPCFARAAPCWIPRSTASFPPGRAGPMCSISDMAFISTRRPKTSRA